MKIKVFYPNNKGEIVFTKEELEKLLDEVYDAGYQEGRSRYWTWTSPYYYTNTAGTITTCANSDSSSSAAPLNIQYGDVNHGPRITMDDDTVFINQTSTGKSFSLNDYVSNIVKD